MSDERVQLPSPPTSPPVVPDIAGIPAHSRACMTMRLSKYHAPYACHARPMPMWVKPTIFIVVAALVMVVTR